RAQGRFGSTATHDFAGLVPKKSRRDPLAKGGEAGLEAGRAAPAPGSPLFWRAAQRNLPALGRSARHADPPPTAPGRPARHARPSRAALGRPARHIEASRAALGRPARHAKALRAALGRPAWSPFS